MDKISFYHNSIVEKEAIFGTELFIPSSFEDGDYFRITTDEPSFLEINLNSMVCAHIYIKDKLVDYIIPCGIQRTAYKPGLFDCVDNRIIACKESKDTNIHNISENPLDLRNVSNIYPHASANAETRGEDIFAARNIIDGMFENTAHGEWPFTSWGEDENPNAELTIHFGRKVCISSLQIEIRADFPHDNWWKTIDVSLGDSSPVTFLLKKTGNRQKFVFVETVAEEVKVFNLRKDETDPSCFPALSQLTVYGRDL